MLPHASVHRGSDEHRPGVGERRLREHVVGEAVRETGHRVRGQRGDHEQLGALQVRVGILGLRGPREGVERLGGDEPLGTARRQGQHVVARRDEPADQLTGLVGGDAAGDAEDDPRHGS